MLIFSAGKSFELVGRYRRFGEICDLYRQGCWGQTKYVTLKHWYLPTSWHGVTAWESNTDIRTTVRTSRISLLMAGSVLTIFVSSRNEWRYSLLLFVREVTRLQNKNICTDCADEMDSHATSFDCLVGVITSIRLIVSSICLFPKQLLCLSWHNLQLRTYNKHLKYRLWIVNENKELNILLV